MGDNNMQNHNKQSATHVVPIEVFHLKSFDNQQHSSFHKYIYKHIHNIINPGDRDMLQEGYRVTGIHIYKFMGF